MSEIITIRALLVNYKIVISPRSGEIQGGGGWGVVGGPHIIRFHFLLSSTRATGIVEGSDWNKPLKHVVNRE